MKLLTLVLLSAILLTGCPKNASVRDFKEQSAKLKIYGLKIQVANNNAYRDGLISKEQLGTLTNANSKFRNAVKALDAAIKVGDGSSDVLEKLDRILSEDVVSAFDELVSALTGHKVVNTKVAEWISAIRLALSAMRMLIAGQGGITNAA